MGERALTHGRAPVVLGPGEGRVYPCGSMRAIFKAGGEETGGAYSISEWWQDPHTEGPHAHVHEDKDDTFYVIAGTLTFVIDGEEVVAPTGTYVQASGGAEHTWRNDTDEPAAFLNLCVPDFEHEMPAIAQWFIEHPDG
jgi:quercetin dioxygenase-like cupin family protein